MKKIIACFCCCYLCFIFPAHAQRLEVLTSGQIKSIRGLSVVNDQVFWVSGTEGTVGKTTNGGRTWEWYRVPGCDSLDWRDIEAFDDSKAIVVNAGEPANIYLTRDGGKNWRRVYFNNTKGIFLDAMAFINEDEGLIIGDPLKGKVTVLQTKDGGYEWKQLKLNNKAKTADGEAFFAASGTCLRAIPNTKMYAFVSGGKTANLYILRNTNITAKRALPMIQGESSQGPFSIATWDRKHFVITGGNYMLDTSTYKNCVTTKDGGKHFTAPVLPPGGYRSAVEYISKDLLVSTGTSGTDLSFDGGKTWKNISRDSYNCARKAKDGTIVILAGVNGKVARLAL